MPNILYRYTPSLGMISKNDDEIINFGDWHESEDQALIAWYHEEAKKLIEKIDEATKTIKAHREELAKLTLMVEPMKEKYPEDFI